MSELTKVVVTALVAAILSGSVFSAVIGITFHRRLKEIEAEITKGLTVFQSRRVWKEKSVSELLGPIHMQFERTKRAFDRWNTKNLYLEAKIIREGNLKIRDLLLEKGHLIPPELLSDAATLVEHYDYWLEEFENKRLAENPDLETAFVFAGPAGYPFPRASEKKFHEAFRKYWEELYGRD